MDGRVQANIDQKTNEIRKDCDSVFRKAKMPNYRQNCLSNINAVNSFYRAVTSSAENEKKQLSDVYDRQRQQHESESTRLHSDRERQEARQVSCRSRFQEACRQKEQGILTGKDDFAASWKKMAEAAERKGVNFIEIADDA